MAAAQTPYRPYQPPAPIPTAYAPPTPLTAAPSQPQTTPFRSTLPPRCPFCYETTSHTRMQQCTIYHAALRKNWVYRNENGRLVLPNGQEITRALRGGCFMEQIENWRRDNNYPMDTPDPAVTQTTTRDPPPHQPASAPPPVASANLITVGNYNWSEAEDSSARVEELDEEDGPYDIPMEEQLTIAQNVISTLFKQKKPDSTKKEVRFEQPKRATRSSTASTPTPTPPATTTPPAKPAPSSSSTIPPPAPPVNHLKEALETGQIKSNPQYRYQSNAEDPKIASSVIERALDAPVMITQRELLALAPDLRRHIRDLTMTKRVPTNDTKVLYQECTADCNAAEASSFFNSEADFEQEHALSLLVQERQQLVTANDMESLRVITLKLEDTHFVSCILDSGSQIISMRRAIWEALAIPLDLDKGLVMESANLTTNKTLGLARNIKASIGELDFYLQIQVVESAPYDILLGRPFHCLLSAVTQDYPDGRQDISLRDPNSDLRISIPTTERRIKRCPKGHMHPMHHNSHHFHASMIRQ
ncbi:Plp [Salix suchowensis]|nr:Plp [Salix suchowensis]